MFEIFQIVSLLTVFELFQIESSEEKYTPGKHNENNNNKSTTDKQ